MSVFIEVEGMLSARQGGLEISQQGVDPAESGQCHTLRATTSDDALMCRLDGQASECLQLVRHGLLGSTFNLVTH
jgi:hypothetical protein